MLREPQSGQYGPNALARDRQVARHDLDDGPTWRGRGRQPVLIMDVEPTAKQVELEQLDHMNEIAKL